MELDILKAFIVAVKTGNLPVLTGTLLVLAVALLRYGGPKLRDILPDHTRADKFLTFLFTTKPGGWLLNAATSVSAAVAAAVLAGGLSWQLLGAAVAASFTAAGIWEFIKDVLALKRSAIAEEAGRIAVEETPAPGLSGVMGRPTPNNIIEFERKMLAAGYVKTPEGWKREK